MLLDLAARISTHGIMPDGKQGLTGMVLIMSAEDSGEDTIKPRLVAAGANFDRIRELTHVSANGREYPIELPKNLDLLELHIKAYDARLLIIDPMAAFVVGADANKDQEIRRVLYQLSKIGEKYRCTIVVMRHLNKRSGGSAIYRGNMSIGVIGHARTGLLVAPHPDDEDQRILAVSKCNLAAKPEALAYRLEPQGEVCRVAWLGQTHFSADELVQQPQTDEERSAREAKATRVQMAREILELLLKDAPAGRLNIKQAKAELQSAGLHGSSVDRAVKQLGLAVTYDTDKDGKRIYYWSAQTA